MKLNPTVLSNLKFYMNKKHIDHRGVNNDVQTKLKNISLVACKFMFQSIKQHKTTNILIHLSLMLLTLISLLLLVFVAFFDFIFLPNKLTIHH